MIGKFIKHFLCAFLFLFLGVFFALMLEFSIDCDQYALTLMLEKINEIVKGFVDMIPLGDITVSTILLKINPASYVNYSMVDIINEFSSALILGCCITIMECIVEGATTKAKDNGIIGNILGIFLGCLVLTLPNCFSGWLKTGVSSVVLIAIVVVMVLLIKRIFDEKNIVNFILSRCFLIIIKSLLVFILYSYLIMFSHIMTFEFVKNSVAIAQLARLAIIVCGSYGIVASVESAAKKVKNGEWSWF